MWVLVAREAAIRALIKHWLKIGFGVFFVLLGVAGLFLPILQGILFLAIGATLLASEVPWIERRLHALEARHPKAAHARHAAEQWMARTWHRVFGRFRR